MSKEKIVRGAIASMITAFVLSVIGPFISPLMVGVEMPAGVSVCGVLDGLVTLALLSLLIHFAIGAYYLDVVRTQRIAILDELDDIE